MFLFLHAQEKEPKRTALGGWTPKTPIACRHAAKTNSPKKISGLDPAKSFFDFYIQADFRGADCRWQCQRRPEGREPRQQADFSAKKLLNGCHSGVLVCSGNLF